jgi:hypothetical protein
MNPPRQGLIPHDAVQADPASAREADDIRSAPPPSSPAGDWGSLTRPDDAALQVDDQAALAEAERFFATLADGLPTRWLLELRALAQRPKRVLRRWLPLSAIAAAARWCVQQSHDELDVYGGVQPRRVLKGGASAVAALVTLYVDLDCGPGKRLCDKADALSHLQRLAVLGLQPSMLVDSGNGFHAYWPLREPLEREERPAWRHAMLALAGALHADPSVADLPRILRVPGTLNWKDRSNPKPVRLLELDTRRRFTLLDFDDLLPAHAVAMPDRSVYVPVTVAGERVVAAIRAAGWHVREKRDAEGRLFALVLEEPCPLCPGRPVQAEAPRRGTAHITPRSGAFRCKRAHCTAGAEATGQTANGEPHGVSFDQWAARFAPLVATHCASSNEAPFRAFTLPSPARLPTLRRPPR